MLELIVHSNALGAKIVGLTRIMLQCSKLQAGFTMDALAQGAQQDQPPPSKHNTAGVREREDANRTREAGVLDEIQVAARSL
ncbi:MAG TPA: hypothetical protein VJT71_06610 [Pyrinomonadaceae bacterium]|nr:hypothetical protein [Pyrinomonadaceae bacterium]